MFLIEPTGRFVVAAANDNDDDADDGNLCINIHYPFHFTTQVHSYLNGSWFDVSTSPNDPVFILHHAFVDKLFELWLRKYRPGLEQVCYFSMNPFFSSENFK
ncbi:unnamed protein product [Echinostoma caproni]|uniref:Tyrosinase n=1 Tax=Echinostoma caproni TaxID=27848 RepID=A0A3P8HIY5_9TREM|nr:unnamed protein product [Echinostoma caproni]